MVGLPCLTSSLATDLSPQSPPACLISENVALHHTTEWSAGITPGSKPCKDDSGPDVLGSLVSANKSGHRYSADTAQNTTPHQVISIYSHQAQRPISLLDFPPELMTRILLYLPPLDIISCRRTCRILYDLCGNSNFRYLVQMERSAVSDDMSPGLSYPERLRILEKREEAWATLNFHRSINIPVPLDRSNLWCFTGGALLLGAALDCESHEPTVGHSYITLPSLSDAQDQAFEWKRHDFGTEVLEIQLAVHEHDMMIAALTA
jgi:F-box domain